MLGEQLVAPIDHPLFVSDHVSGHEVLPRPELDRSVKCTKAARGHARRGRESPGAISQAGVMRLRTRAIGVALVAAVGAARCAAPPRTCRSGVGYQPRARNAQLAAIGARSGAAYAAHRTRLAAVRERREELEAEYQLRTAAQVADALGNMKGALMKIGQMASYLDDGLPEPVRDALASLQQDAAPMAPELLRSWCGAELGDDPGACFSRSGIPHRSRRRRSGRSIAPSPDRVSRSR